MVAILNLEAPTEPFEPGEVHTVALTVRNAGTEVDAFLLEAIGPVAPYSTFSAPSVNLVPGDEETVTVSFALPRAPQPGAGSVPFAVKATPGKQPTEPTTEECTVVVAPFVHLESEVTPRNSRGSRRGKHEFAVDNNGNQPLQLEFSGFDEDELLSVEAAPTSASLAPGDTAYVGIRVKPKKRFFRGPDKTQSFKLLTASAELEPHFDAAAFTQTPLLPKWFWKAVLAALALLLLVVVLFMLAKNNIESSARSAAEEVAEEAVNEAIGGGGGGGGADDGGGGGADDDGGADDAGEDADGGEDGEPPDVPGVPSGSVSFRLTSADPSFALDEGQELLVTDILFSNPDGESGRIQVLRGGTVLLESELRNFRDLDQHFRTPLEFDQANQLSISIGCGGACSSSVTFSGFVSS